MLICIGYGFSSFSSSFSVRVDIAGLSWCSFHSLTSCETLVILWSFTWRTSKRKPHIDFIWDIFLFVMSSVFSTASLSRCDIPENLFSFFFFLFSFWKLVVHLFRTDASRLKKNKILWKWKPTTRRKKTSTFSLSSLFFIVPVSLLSFVLFLSSFFWIWQFVLLFVLCCLSCRWNSYRDPPVFFFLFQKRKYICLCLCFYIYVCMYRILDVYYIL